MTITALPAAPSVTDPVATFNSKAFAWTAALPAFVTEANALAVAMNLNSTTDTSSSSVLIGSGAKTFTVTAGKSFQPGMYLIIADSAAPSTNSMFGQITSYSGTTLIMDILSVRGSGTKTAWTISQSSSGGAAIGSSADITSKIQPITATVAANALTVGLSPTYLDFRSSSLTNGTVNTRRVSAELSLVVPSGATLGSSNAIKSRLYVLAIDNAGTVELAIVNASGGNNLNETTLISTTAITDASDAANIIYSTSARSNVPFRVVGFVESTQTTAGTWATAPSTIQGSGGNSLISLGNLNYGKTIQNLTGSRALSTTYTNSSGYTISVQLSVSCSASGIITIQQNGVQAQAISVATSNYASFAFEVLNADTYGVAISSGTFSLNGWFEQR